MQLLHEVWCAVLQASFVHPREPNRIVKLPAQELLKSPGRPLRQGTSGAKNVRASSLPSLTYLATGVPKSFFSSLGSPKRYLNNSVETARLCTLTHEGPRAERRFRVGIIDKRAWIYS